MELHISFLLMPQVLRARTDQGKFMFYFEDRLPEQQRWFMKTGTLGGAKQCAFIKVSKVNTVSAIS